MELTTSRVNRAGRTLRRWWANPEALWDAKVLEAFDVLHAFRASHSRPLIKANNGLRSMVRTEGCTVEVSQRLKRTVTIIDKLTRQPTMSLSRMQDIAGCRSIVNNIDELRRVQKRVLHRRRPLRVDDYVISPPPSGYRAIHIVVEYDDRCVEIQLRTRLMHEWAVAVERLGGQINTDLKSGDGPAEVLDWLRAVATALSVEDEGRVVDTMFMDQISRLKAVAAKHLVPGGQS